MPLSASEQTPLLHVTSANHQDRSRVTRDAVTTTQIAQQREGAAPHLPISAERRSGLPIEPVQSDDLSTITDETECLVGFQKNGKLDSIGVWKFRLIFGGILLGYFVSTE
jgi:hypothetical protein